MAIITIIGAGMMGSAMAFPACRSFLGVYSRALSLQNVTHGASSLAAPGSWLGTQNSHSTSDVLTPSLHFQEDP